MRACPWTWLGAWRTRRRAAAFATVMYTALSAFGGTIVADVPDCTRLLAVMLAEEVLAAGVTNVIGTGKPTD